VATEGNTAGQPRQVGWRVQVQRLIQAISDGDLAAVEAAILRISRSRRWLAPLALAVGAFAMLFEGMKLLPDAVGRYLVRGVAERRRRGDDVLLRHRAGQAHRHADRPLEA
jgi:hypothetical protein